jgi:DNA helicase-2/ATP-dependent DNA helicase PcrA
MTTIDVALSEVQRRAVEYDRGPLLVLAGAGSGKTRVLTARIAHMVGVRRVPPERVLAVTFTNRAANEMRERVGQLLHREPRGLWIGTFHAICARLLRREAARLGFTPQFTIYDEDDRRRLIKRLVERARYASKAYPPRQIQSIISSAKNRLLTPGELAGEAVDRTERVAAEIYADLAAVLQTANAMDFDDLLLHPLRLFEEHPDRLDFYQRRFDAILVDEFQDTNRAQYLFARHLACRHGNLCVVGDDDQSIYSWRGADVRNMLDFHNDFPTAEIVRLEENYRSTQVILDAANGVIAENVDRLGKTLFTVRRGGEHIQVMSAADERDEADWIAGEIIDRITADRYEHAEAAILYRTNAQSRAFEETFRRKAIPYRVVGAVSFYERREVRDLVAYLRLVVNPSDDEAFLRAITTPKRGIGVASVRTLNDAAAGWHRSLLSTAQIADRVIGLRPQAKRVFQDFAELIAGFRRQADGSSPAALLEHVIERIEYQQYLANEGQEGFERMDNVRELLAAAAEWAEEVTDEETGATPVEQFLQNAALTTSAEQIAGDANGVTLMTVHTAKGLEWPIVFVAGMEDGLFPLSRSFDVPNGVEEERRLAYVAITRAKDRVYLSWARTRRRGGQVMPSSASRFLDALPPGIVDEKRTGSGLWGGDWDRPSKYPSSWLNLSEAEPVFESQVAPRYVKGERVRHRRFGSGVIRELAGHGRNLKVTVEFDDDTVGRKQLLVAYAGLEREIDAV